MKLSAGDWTLTAAPERGGAILSLTRAGRDVFRLTPPDAVGAIDVACFPLVPYANRIADGTFTWHDRTITLPRNHPDHAHPLHGIGWLRAWQVMHVDESEAVMRLQHPGDADWPWAFACEQHLMLAADGLTATLSLHNRSAEAMPFSLGFHPYFVHAHAVAFDAGGMWLTDAGLLPTQHVPANTLGDWSRGGSLERADLVDLCYTDWSGLATIARDDGDIRLLADGAQALHLYVPPGEAFFCAEPVTAMPDAVNRGQAATLAPDEEAHLSMTVRSA